LELERRSPAPWSSKNLGPWGPSCFIRLEEAGAIPSSSGLRKLGPFLLIGFLKGLLFLEVKKTLDPATNAELDWAGSDPKVRENTRQQLEANPLHPSAKADSAVS